MSGREAISPAVFDFVDRAIEQLSADSVASRLAPTAPIREFCQNFFAQFFENVLNVEAQSISDSGAREARRISRSQGEHDALGGATHPLATVPEALQARPRPSRR